ncbi:Uncharacterized protein dnm_073420 [Desulfonema magnum]|uniref:Uncharacterized protein n=1 Tax=Desulfonema magnum TaxID=45655 RepID=A0A975BTP8_9BACT|nr:Uncharacterized protein dnm_073420 [Desulfonema magnum]
MVGCQKKRTMSAASDLSDGLTEIISDNSAHRGFGFFHSHQK